jgi:hypothetical protein
VQVDAAECIGHRPTQPVHLTHHTEARYEPAEILNALPAPETSARADARKPRGRSDPLLEIPPARYAEVLLGEPVGVSGKIRCPFHSDGTPSLHVYADPERGWACFGCDTPDGRPLGGDIYTLASLLWDISTRGHDFHALRGRLDVLFEVKRD